MPTPPFLEATVRVGGFSMVSHVIERLNSYASPWLGNLGP